MIRFRIGLIVSVAVLLATTSKATAVQFHLTDLGTLFGGSLNEAAYDINNNGQVVGRSGYPVYHAYLWTSAGGMQDLGTLPTTFRHDSQAHGVNSGGQVVGASSVGNDNLMHAFLWTSTGGMHDLGVLPGGDVSGAGSINDVGQVVGAGNTDAPHRPYHAFLWTSNGGMQDLGTLAGGTYSNAFDINNSGQVVGLGDTSAGYRAFLWTSTGGMQILDGLTAGSSSNANAISNNGQVVGASATGISQAVVWTSTGSIQGLGWLPGGFNSVAWGVNDAGQVVGDSNMKDSSGNLSSAAFFWTSALGMQNLNDLLDSSGAGWNLTAAFSNNDMGQIVGVGTLNGQNRSFLLTPVPEPSTLVLCGASIFCLLSLAAKRGWPRFRSHVSHATGN